MDDISAMTMPQKQAAADVEKKIMIEQAASFEKKLEGIGLELEDEIKPTSLSPQKTQEEPQLEAKKEDPEAEVRTLVAC